MSNKYKRNRNDDVYIGLEFPLDHNLTGFFRQSKTIQEQVKSNIKFDDITGKFFSCNNLNKSVPDDKTYNITEIKYKTPLYCNKNIKLTKDKNVYKLDWFSLFIALVAIVLWQITDDLLVSVVLVTVADLIGTIPTLRKCYSYPWDETVIHFSIEFSKFLISFLAMSAFNPLTVLYPLGAMLSNLSLVLMIVWRRKCMSGN